MPRSLFFILFPFIIAALSAGVLVKAMDIEPVSETENDDLQADGIIGEEDFGTDPNQPMEKTSYDDFIDKEEEFFYRMEENLTSEENELFGAEIMPDENGDSHIDEPENDADLFENLGEDILREIDGADAAANVKSAVDALPADMPVVNEGGNSQVPCPICMECGKGIFNICDMNECAGLGECVFFGRSFFGGKCVPVSTECGGN